nr:hypothetical protein Itr_chr01CG13120 [Ipomoea trifida]
MKDNPHVSSSHWKCQKAYFTVRNGSTLSMLIPIQGWGHQAEVGSAGQGPQGRVASSKDKGKFTINDVVAAAGTSSID